VTRGSVVRRAQPAGVAQVLLSSTKQRALAPLVVKVEQLVTRQQLLMHEGGREQREAAALAVPIMSGLASCMFVLCSFHRRPHHASQRHQARHAVYDFCGVFEPLRLL
jgi:hypothetical protein